MPAQFIQRLVKELNLPSTTSPFSDCGFADRREDHKPCVVGFHWFASTGTSGIRTHTHRGLSSAAIPVRGSCRRSTFGFRVSDFEFRISQASPMGFEPTISTVTGWRALRAAPRGQSVAAVARLRVTLNDPAFWRTRLQAPGGSRGTRTHKRLSRHLFSRQAPHPAG